MRLRNRKAQAALEFLTTYGWAFLVILVMIGALAYFGVLNPDRFLPKRCNFGQEFRCTDSGISNVDGDIQFSVFLVNNKGVGLLVSEIVVTDESGHSWDATAAGDCEFDGDGDGAGHSDVDTAVTWNAGDPAEVRCSVISLADFTPEGSKGKLDFEVTFQPVGGKYNDKVGGEVYSTVLDAVLW